jgi:hypothetical protein
MTIVKRWSFAFEASLSAARTTTMRRRETHASAMAKGMLRLRADDRFAILTAPLSMTNDKGAGFN